MKTYRLAAHLSAMTFRLHPRITLTFMMLLSLAMPATSGQPVQVGTCNSCHGDPGEPILSDIPVLMGQRRDYLVKQLSAFKSGTRKNDVMQAVAAQLSVQDILSLADQLSKLGPTTAASQPQASATGIPTRMTFPKGFPEGLTEYDREFDPATKLVFVRYANRAAMDAARTGQPMPPGSTLITGEYAVALDDAGSPRKDAQGRWLTAALQSISGMQTERGWGNGVPSLLRNKDWNYGLWSPSGESRLGARQALCLACHKPLASQDHIFTMSALRGAASQAARAVRP